MRWEKWREASQWWGFAVVKRDQERPYGEVGEEVRKFWRKSSAGREQQLQSPKVLYKPPTCLVHRRKSTEAGVAGREGVRWWRGWR